jgi:ferredoxin
LQPSQAHINSSSHDGWRRAQALSLTAGVAITLTLAFDPQLGARLFWNLVIPLIPAAVVFFPGGWRNICPLASAAAAGNSATSPSGRKMSLTAQGISACGSISLLALVLPMRHIIFDLNGRATLLLLFAIGVVAFVLTRLFLAKSGWCSGWCPVSSVEKLYGQSPALDATNTRCTLCSHCVAVCPDSIRKPGPLRSTPTTWHRIADTVMAGAFVGFVWGWFQVPDQAGVGAGDIVYAYAVPLLAGVGSLALFLLFREVVPSKQQPRLVRLFAAAAVSCYYWYRLPALFGFSMFGDGVLIDLSGVLPVEFMWACRVVTTSFLCTWLLTERGTRQWLMRPPTRAAA